MTKTNAIARYLAARPSKTSSVADLAASFGDSVAVFVRAMHNSGSVRVGHSPDATDATPSVGISVRGITRFYDVVTLTKVGEYLAW